MSGIKLMDQYKSPVCAQMNYEQLSPEDLEKAIIEKRMNKLVEHSLYSSFQLIEQDKTKIAQLIRDDLSNKNSYFRKFIGIKKFEDNAKRLQRQIALVFYIGLAVIVIFWQKVNRKQKTNDSPEEFEPVSPPFATAGFHDNFEVSFADKIETRLEDVKGIDEIKDEVLEVIDILHNYEKYNKAGAKNMKGILLVGKPGTGKTLLARALAGETNLKFIFCNGADFDMKYVGQGNKKLKKIFQVARQNQPCIIYIDEIDSLLHKGRRQGSYFN